MELLVNFVNFLPVLLILMGVGAVSGIIGGMFGIGGGIVIVPILYHIADSIDFTDSYRMQTIMGTTLASIIFTGIGSLKTHIRHKEIDWSAIKELAPLMFIGAIFGSFLNSLFKDDTITAIFAIFCLILSIKLSIKTPKARKAHLPRKGFSYLVATFIGSFSAMMGIGGGTLSVPFLKSFGFTMQTAAGTSSLLTSVIALSGSISYLLTGWNATGLTWHYIGYINWLALICIVPTTMLFAPLGAFIARKMKDIVLSRCFALLLIINAGKMLFNVWR